MRVYHDVVMLVWWLWGIEPENVGDAVGGIQSNFLRAYEIQVQ